MSRLLSQSVFPGPPVLESSDDHEDPNQDPHQNTNIQKCKSTQIKKKTKIQKYKIQNTKYKIQNTKYKIKYKCKAKIQKTDNSNVTHKRNEGKWRTRTILF